MTRWLLVLAAACGASARPPPPKTLQLNVTGDAVDVEAALVPGYVILVDFWSESCAACEVVAAKIAAAIADQPRVLVRKVDVGDGFTPAARAYEIGVLPHWNVHDRQGRLRYVLIGNECLRAPALARALLAEP